MTPLLPTPPKLHLLRHGRAAAADDHRLPGPDRPLLPTGRAQAAAAAARLATEAPPVAAVFASDARRAAETAAIVAARCRAPLLIRPGLRELDFGAWSGRTYAEVVAAEPAAAAYFTDPASAPPPGGEPAAAVAGRTIEALTEAAAAAGDGASVVVVGHAGSLRLAVARLLGMPLAGYWRLRLDCGGLSTLAWEETAVIVERWNETAHLAPLNPEPEPTPNRGAGR